MPLQDVKTGVIPILYSLQHCPYAMRARIAIFRSKQRVLIRAVKLNNKPQEMLLASPKGSVPVLVLDHTVLEESLEIMLWALAQSDPDDLLPSTKGQSLPEMIGLINHFEAEFVPALEAYSCAKRYHDDNLAACRQRCEVVLSALEERLSKHSFLFSESESIVDLAIMPFIRKFARVERQWYLQSPYPNLRRWLDSYLQSRMFSKVMEKHELWLENRLDLYFGDAIKPSR
ncbi:glutathione S-transferase [Vibrio methylphosphonaticus]|uniref:glutathione S-transferase n=1 Tax=Vibrio methylphosphonaticus TaxID=2946866 RepID=UPI00202A6DD0|nr:glutathione S-transferase [Vibrio methylphosphonaticus]MCL9777145.1 glutathione S-transferase [Vibrio methylphosphonaticus]